MGLDQYARTRSGVELAYWRKHPNLQGWMEQLWRERGGTGDFNCKELELSVQDLDRLEEAVKNHELPPTTGFFFGSDSDDYYRKEDLAFIAKAREAIAAGEVVEYSSWW